MIRIHTVQLLTIILVCYFLRFSHAFAARKGKKSASRNKNRQRGSGGFAVPTPRKSSRYTADDSLATKHLLNFLESHEAEGASDGALEIGFSQSGLRGIFASPTSSFEPGEYLCAIPFPATIVVEQGSKDLETTDAQRGALFLQNFMNDPRWADYLGTLPTMDSLDTTPDSFEDDEIQMLELPNIIERVQRQKEEIQTLSKSEGIDLKLLQYATSLVRSRKFTTFRQKDGDVTMVKTVLIPFFDMLNHSSDGANAELQVLETPDREDESFYTLQAIRKIRPNQEITISYGTGTETSADLFCKYGFVPERNSNDAHALERSFRWATTLDEDLATRKTAEGNIKRILDLRIKLKQATLN